MIILKCIICNNEFATYPCRMWVRKTCSKKCKYVIVARSLTGNKYRLGSGHTDEWKKRISAIMIGNKNGFRKGYKPWNWLEDRRKLKKKNERNDPAYREWVRNVKIRDKNCKLKDENCRGYMTVHHIRLWSKYPRLRYKIKNGITLCQHHHPRRRADEKMLIPVFTRLVEAK